MGTVDVELENPFAEDAEFSVALKETLCCDAEKQPAGTWHVYKRYIYIQIYR